MTIQATTQAILRSRVIRLWGTPRERPGTLAMGGEYLGAYLLLGDDHSIQEFTDAIVPRVQGAAD